MNVTLRVHKGTAESAASRRPRNIHLPREGVDELIPGGTSDSLLPGHLLQQGQRLSRKLPAVKGNYGHHGLGTRCGEGRHAHSREGGLALLHGGQNWGADHDGLQEMEHKRGTSAATSPEKPSLPQANTIATLHNKLNADDHLLDSDGHGWIQDEKGTEG